MAKRGEVRELEKLLSQVECGLDSLSLITFSISRAGTWPRAARQQTSFGQQLQTHRDTIQYVQKTGPKAAREADYY